MPASASAEGTLRARSRPLPHGRAIVGGLLVVAAVVVAVAATADGEADGRQPYAVAAHDLAAGRILGAVDLATAPGELDDGVAARAFPDPSVLEGTVVVNPLAAGELIQRSHVAAATPGDDTDRAAIEVTFPVERDRAPSSLQPGERVTMLATTNTPTDATTRVTVSDAIVVAYDTSSEGFSASEQAVLTLALASSEDHVAIVHDTQVADLSIIRANSGGVGDD